MSASDFLTAPEVLRELESSGAQVEGRTLRYWTTRGLLPKLVKKPYRGADGRVGYYPRSVLTTIAEILRLQADGWKLEQIRKQLTAPKKRRRASLDPSAQDFALKYLQELLSDQPARERRKMLYAGTEKPSEVRQLRSQLVSRLERIVGRKEAVRAVSTFLLSLSKRQTRRLASRLRLSRSPSQDKSIDWVSREEVWKDDRRLQDLQEQIDEWAFPATEPAPVLGQRASHLLSQLQKTVAEMSGLPPLKRKPHAMQVESLLEAFKRLGQQAQENADFLDSLQNVDT